jgi:hypothetical protein
MDHLFVLLWRTKGGEGNWHTSPGSALTSRRLAYNAKELSEIKDGDTFEYVIFEGYIVSAQSMAETEER